MDITKNCNKMRTTCVHGPLCVEAVCAALVRLSSQSDPYRLLGQSASTYRPEGIKVQLVFICIWSQ